MAECGKRVGAGVVTYPCQLDGGHDGPCVAPENTASQRARDRWAAAQRQPVATPTDMPISLADVSVCEACKVGSHVSCDSVECPCFRLNVNAHILVEDERTIEVTCEACQGQKVIVQHTAFTAATGLPPVERPCDGCDGSGVVSVPVCPEVANGWACSRPMGHDGPCRAGPEQVAPTKTRPGDQVLPTTNRQPFVQRLVIADIEERIKVGIERYGTPLQAFNGRNSARDLYEELIDGAMYARQLLIEAAEMCEAMLDVVAYLTVLEGQGMLHDPAVLDKARQVTLWLNTIGPTVSGGAPES